ncbi:MAG: anaerobic glycerol-3-phosphate dehydrogenase subunit C [Planctomycetota bacterium]|nr:MAG: anaerobic glycerol-3-phosphate dehydrogenase subunit C [Planctomycetota bacterium]
MDAEQLRIEEDLRGQIVGDVHCNDLFVQMYASDASIFEIQPLGVARPRTRDDVAAIVRYAAERGVPLYPRGGGTGLAGDSLGRGLVVDFSKYFRRILSVGEETAVAQSGVVLAQLNERLRSHGRVFGPDPAALEVTTLGSVIARDASGSHWPAYGSTRKYVDELEVVLSNGRIARLSRHAPAAAADINDNPGAYLAAGVADILARHRPAIEGSRRKTLIDRSGYQLLGIEGPEGVIDLARLLVGSEGTLAVITEATVRTVPLPVHVGSMLLFFTSLEAAAQAGAELSTTSIRACDLMDRRHLSLARENDPRYEFLIPAEAEAVLLVECEAASSELARQRLRELQSLLIDKLKLASGAHTAIDPYDQEVLWHLARRYVPTLHRLRGASRPIPYVEDIAVPPAALPNFIQRALETLRGLQITASIFGHAAHGELHIRPFIDIASEEDAAKLRQLAAELYGHAWELGGTISGEHSEGYSRTPYMAGQHGPLMPALAELKQLFDPRGILNPGKKVPAETVPLEAPRRRVALPLVELQAGQRAAAPGERARSFTPGTLTALQLDWQAEEMAYAARVCNGCGICRTQSYGVRMCPTFRPAPREEAAPRSKANIVRAVLTGSLPSSIVADDAFKDLCDQCVHCHMCRLECPANVDVPKLMAEAKGAYVATNGLRSEDWFVAHIDRLCSYAAMAPRLANWAISNRVVRWMLERTLGIAQGRKLPRFNRRPFLDSPTQRRLGRLQRGGGEKALLFVDTFANYCDAQLAEALVAVLEHNGISVYVPERQLQAGMPMISQGVLGAARAIAERNVALLAEAVRQGYTIISTEPSAVLALKREYRHLLGDDSDAELVSESVMEACHYLWRWHQKGRLQLDFKPLDITVGYHAPCHLKALEVGMPTVNLLGLIPGLRVRHIEKGCSGAAGLFGFQRKNYRMSLRIGLPLIAELRTARYAAGVTECSTCRIQMEQGSSLPTIHPIKLLALSYGLKPELRQLLNSPSETLVVR